MPAGRPRVPTHLKLLRNNPGKRKIEPEKEPQPEKGAPRCPPFITGEKRKIWKWTAKILDQMGIGSRADLLIMEGLCNQLMTLRKAENRLEKRRGNLLLKSPKSGWPMAHPLIAIRDNAWRNTQSILQELGFTPAARTRLRVQMIEEKVDPFEAWQQKKKA